MFVRLCRRLAVWQRPKVANTASSSTRSTSAAITSCGVSKGEAGDQDFQELPATKGENMLGQPLLGERLLCQYTEDG